MVYFWLWYATGICFSLHTISTASLCWKLRTCGAWYLMTTLSIIFNRVSFFRSPPTTISLPYSWWRHQMEAFSALLAICAGNSPVTGEFPSQTPVTRSFDVFCDLRLNKRFSKQSWGWWFETLSRPLWRHCNEMQLGKVTPWNGNIFRITGQWWGESIHSERARKCFHLMTSLYAVPSNESIHFLVSGRRTTWIRGVSWMKHESILWNVQYRHSLEIVQSLWQYMYRFQNPY